MNGQDLLNGMGYVEDSHVQEAETKTIVKKKRTNAWKFLTVVAAGIVLVVAACIALRRPNSGDEETSSGDVPELIDTKQTMSEESLVAEVPSVIEIDLSKINVNEHTADMVWDVGRIYPDPNACVDTVWEEADIVAYYGTNMVPPYVPAGLQAAEGNATHQVVLSLTGEVWEDTIILNFDAENNYEDGIPVRKGFLLTASKLGILHDVLYLGQEWRVSNIGETEVLIGYRARSYGPYEEPDGYYDYYVAFFEYEDTEYELQFSWMEFEEVVKIIASIIYDSADIETVGEAKLPVSDR